MIKPRNMTTEQLKKEKSCQWCGTRDKPMAFHGELWCCELHRKYLMNEATPPAEELFRDTDGG